MKMRECSISKTYFKKNKKKILKTIKNKNGKIKKKKQSKYLKIQKKIKKNLKCV